jgi:hypothetical protein
MAKKKIDPKAKAKRQKIYAGIGGVILLAVLAFQVPRTLKMLHPADTSSSSSPPASTTTSTTPAPISAPSLAGGNASASTAAATPGGDGINDPDAVPPPESGQLLAFGLFRSKDPFVQQLNLQGATGSSGVLPGSAGSSSSGGATGPTGVATGSSGGAAPKPQATPVKSQPSAPATSAVISVNGAPETVQVGGTFPTSDPYFKLVALTKKGAKISIAGGSLETGAPTITLTKNKPLTLMNTADGTRYVLRLVSVS